MDPQEFERTLSANRAIIQAWAAGRRKQQRHSASREHYATAILVPQAPCIRCHKFLVPRRFHIEQAPQYRSKERHASAPRPY